MRKIILIFISCLCLSAVSAATLQVEKLYGNDFEIAITTIGKVVLEPERLVFYDRNGDVLFSADLASIGAITFAENNSEALLPVSSEYKIYPNPVSTHIIVEGLDAHTAVRIFDLNGQMVKSAFGPQIDMSGVPAGNYFLQVKNQIVKIIKK